MEAFMIYLAPKSRCWIKSIPYSYGNHNFSIGHVHDGVLYLTLSSQLASNYFCTCLHDIFNMLLYYISHVRNHNITMILNYHVLFFFRDNIDLDLLSLFHSTHHLKQDVQFGTSIRISNWNDALCHTQFISCHQNTAVTGIHRIGQDDVTTV